MASYQSSPAFTFQSKVKPISTPHLPSPQTYSPKFNKFLTISHQGVTFPSEKRNLQSSRSTTGPGPTHYNVKHLKSIGDGPKSIIASRTSLCDDRQSFPGPGSYKMAPSCLKENAHFFTKDKHKKRTSISPSPTTYVVRSSSLTNIGTVIGSAKKFAQEK